MNVEPLGERLPPRQLLRRRSLAGTLLALGLSPYALALLDAPWVNVFLLGWSVFLTFVCLALLAQSYRIMRLLAGEEHLLLLFFVLFFVSCVAFGLTSHYMYILVPGTYTATRPLDWFDFVFLSFITVCTVGYGDIVPTQPISQSWAILEVCFYLWFVMTVIPAAVAAQTRSERLKALAEHDERLTLESREDEQPRGGPTQS